jgi:hypothetical protein
MFSYKIEKNKVQKALKAKINSNKKNDNQNWYKYNLEDIINFWKGWCKFWGQEREKKERRKRLIRA